MKLKQNIGPKDGFTRAVLGIGFFLIAYLHHEGVIDGVLEVIGTLLVLTAVVGYCPVYALFGMSTRKPEQE